MAFPFSMFMVCTWFEFNTWVCPVFYPEWSWLKFTIFYILMKKKSIMPKWKCSPPLPLIRKELGPQGPSSPSSHHWSLWSDKTICYSLFGSATGRSVANPCTSLLCPYMTCGMIPPAGNLWWRISQCVSNCYCPQDTFSRQLVQHAEAHNSVSSINVLCTLGLSRGFCQDHLQKEWANRETFDSVCKEFARRCLLIIMVMMIVIVCFTGMYVIQM